MADIPTLDFWIAKTDEELLRKSLNAKHGGNTVLSPHGQGGDYLRCNSVETGMLSHLKTSFVLARIYVPRDGDKGEPFVQTWKNSVFPHGLLLTQSSDAGELSGRHFGYAQLKKMELVQMIGGSSDDFITNAFVTYATSALKNQERDGHLLLYLPSELSQYL